MQVCIAYLAILLTLIGLTYQHDTSTMGTGLQLQFSREQLVSLSNRNIIMDHNITKTIKLHKLARFPPTRRCTRGGVKAVKQIKINITGARVTNLHKRGVNQSSLITVT